MKIIEFHDNFPVSGEAYALLTDGVRFAFAWGPTYPYAGEVPAQNVLNGESGIEWHISEDVARDSMHAAMKACGDNQQTYPFTNRSG